MEQIVSYELAPVPTSMFEKNIRDLHIAKSKSILMNNFKLNSQLVPHDNLMLLS